MNRQSRMPNADCGRRNGETAAQPVPDSAFRAIVFDWDGTAVVDRHEDAEPLVGLAEALLRVGVWLIVVTGTNLGNIDRQFSSRLRPSSRRHVLICANRGSEVYGFDHRGRVVRRYQRVATAQEEQTLTAIAEDIRSRITAITGLEIGIIYDRLNRRKIDLIPLPEWSDPPKAQIAALLSAVETRLRSAGLAGGLAEAVRIAEQSARDHGMPDARITSDVKHIEVGLTDKGDALAWVKQHLLPHLGINMSEVLIAGDEFGPLAGITGSDDRLRAAAGDATVVSVGVEPNGVPPGVLHLGGGPPRFRALLADQVWRHRRAAPANRQPATGNRQPGAGPPSSDRRSPTTGQPGWQLDERGYHPAIEHGVESRCTVGNGLLGVRGSMTQATRFSRARTFIAGLFGITSHQLPLPALVAGPDWLRLRLHLDGEPTSVSVRSAPAHCRTLDLAHGVLLCTSELHTAAGLVACLHEERFASLADRSLAVQTLQIDVAQPCWVQLEARVEPTDDRLLLVRTDHALTVWRPAGGSRELEMVTAGTAHDTGIPISRRRGEQHQAWGWVATPDQPVLVRRIIAVARRDPENQGDNAATRALRRARRAGLPTLRTAHDRAWAARWAAADVEVHGDDQAQRALRFAVYHLVSAANPADERVSIGARALTGDAYLGHVFWDTEIFLLPFYTLTWPAAARALLMYRYHTLPAARAKAARLGYRGALYAWESADTGEEATPPWVIAPDGEVIPIRSGDQEQHISADIAYAVWQYWQATHDLPFLLNAGAEILLETARFWASRARLEDDGRYHIRGVIGPDEYHEDVDDNAYTNGMAQWNIECALAAAQLLGSRRPERWAALAERLGVTLAELEQWRDVAARLVTGPDPSTGLFEQFAGFFNLEPVDLAAYTPRAAPMDVLLGRERTQRSQVIKQADVVMLLALLWDRVPPAVRAANFRYYEPRCGHGSSLSPAIHALVAARLGDLPVAERYFHQSAAIDLHDSMGNAAGGVHIGALGGLWQAAVFGFAGVRLERDGLRLDPHLPEIWTGLRFAVQWRRRTVRFQVHGHPRAVTATLERGRPLMLAIGDLRVRLRAGQPWRCRWDSQQQRWKEAPP
jgi:trehalose/maltose hydrolase-like predicted phosphorylase/hydroxymethylpyrimidine pyrophosphatase-like HAD family hydrolase